MSKVISPIRIVNPGRNPLDLCTNGRYAVQQTWSHIAGALNSLSAHRKRTFAMQSWATGTTGIAAGRFVTGPATNTVSFRVYSFPSTSTSTADEPVIEVAINDGGGAVVKELRPPGRVSVGSFNPGAISQGWAYFTVDPQTVYDWSVDATGFSNFVSVVVLEEPNYSYGLTDAATDDGKFVNPALVRTGAEITDETVAAAWDVMVRMWKWQGPQYIADHYDAGIAVTATTSHNLFQQATVTAWDATAGGYPIRPLYHGKQNDIASPVHCYAYITGSAATGEVKFESQAGTVATLSYNGTPGLFTADGDIQATYDDDKIDLLVKKHAVGTMSVMYVGMFAYES